MNLENFLLENESKMGFTFSKTFGKAKKRVIAKKTGAASSAPKKPKKSSISNTELENILRTLETVFNQDSFKRRDIVQYAPAWGIKETQVTSRLTAMVRAGKLEDLGGSPKSYKVVS